MLCFLPVLLSSPVSFASQILLVSPADLTYQYELTPHQPQLILRPFFPEVPDLASGSTMATATHPQTLDTLDSVLHSAQYSFLIKLFKSTCHLWVCFWVSNKNWYQTITKKLNFSNKSSPQKCINFTHMVDPHNAEWYTVCADTLRMDWMVKKGISCAQ